jgi:hypothetical protein
MKRMQAGSSEHILLAMNELKADLKMEMSSCGYFH